MKHEPLPDLSLVDLDEVRARAWHNHTWDGGCALSPHTPPGLVISLIDEIRALQSRVRELEARIGAMR